MLRREQLIVSLMMAIALALTFVVLSVLAHHTPVIANNLARQTAKHKAVDGIFYYDGGYIDEGDYVLLGQLSRADYSSGGVYFIGASEMNTSIMPWTLSPAEQRLIHNYAIGDMRITDARNFLRMLIEENGLLAAGGRKTTIILGVTYQMARPISASTYVADLFHRHGLYRYSRSTGIQNTTKSSIARYFILERDLINRYLRTLVQPSDRVGVETDSDPAKRAHMLKVMTGDWRATMQAELQELAALIDYLQQRNVRVEAVLPPIGTWQDALPFHAAFQEMALPILQKRNVPIRDFERLLTDQEFTDALHVRYSAQMKVHKAYRELALQALEEMGTKVGP